ncbi:hypothetical protein ROSINTL182_05405 [Roseburia intestinalis L1-82]|uniref:Uncharacterized protein n=1 Tax=Roseburia intestinalis L1-82 TaxID=536231 RepID=C7G693_9FIRM|nr:hypothetical protein ROSINTL182_05405 [Roseburia intestinalis L1-82]
MRKKRKHLPYYTIPSDNRELQRNKVSCFCNKDYTIPSDNRELQHIRHKL